jgi:hypothetical protein
LFDHPGFRKYTFEDIPIEQDIFIMDIKWAAEHEAAWIKLLDEGEQFDPVGYIGYAAARHVNDQSIELSWYPNITDRFHEVRVFLPRDQFLDCVSVFDYDGNPHLFVTSAWFENLYSRAFSAFALVDAIGVKAALENGALSRENLIALRTKIDEVAARHAEMSFISFGDSLLLKSNWHSGNVERGIKYSYAPEALVNVVAELKPVFIDTIGLNIYAILGQGSNEYYDDSLLHISEPHKNHVSLNSLGLPFVQLFAIDHAARTAIKSGHHRAAEIYMDSNFFFSLRFNLAFAMEKHSVESGSYRSPMISGESRYFISDIKTLTENFESASLDGGTIFGDAVEIAH